MQRFLLGEVPMKENRELAGEGRENHPNAKEILRRTGRKVGWEHPRLPCCQRKSCDSQGQSGAWESLG